MRAGARPPPGPGKSGGAAGRATTKSYHPPQSASTPWRPGRERVVQSRWDTDPNRTRYNYVTPDFAIGSAGGGDYGAQDKMIGVELASPKKLPVLAIMPDATDSPYGKEKTLDKSGHPKPTHLPMRPVCVQEKGTVLAMLDLDTSGVPETRSIATNVLLPAAADAITLDGRRVSTAAEFEQPAPPDSVVGVREGNAGVAIRVFHADGLGGQKAAVVLKADAAGLKEGVARLAVYHYRGEPRAFGKAGGPSGDKGGKGQPDTHVRVGLLIVAGRCATDGDFQALVRRREGGEGWFGGGKREMAGRGGGRGRYPGGGEGPGAQEAGGTPGERPGGRAASVDGQRR